MTKREVVYQKIADREFDLRMKAQNKVAHEFDRLFKAYEGRPPIKIGGKSYKNCVETGWKYEGYELMERIGRWAKKYPKDVFVCGIDDTVFTSSDIVFILHRIKRKLWGTSVVVITQCDNLPPKEFFMYPGHRAGIQMALAQMAKLKRMP